MAGDPRPDPGRLDCNSRAATGARSWSAWTQPIEQDGRIDPVAQVAELTGLWRRAGRPDGLRFIARRVKPSRRHAKKLTEFEKATGRRHQLIVTNIRDLGRGVPGSHHRLPGLDHHDDLAAAEPETLRTAILHIPSRRTTHARRRILKIEHIRPRATAAVEAWERGHHADARACRAQMPRKPTRRAVLIRSW